MKALVTGGGGQLANAVRQAAPDSIEVISLDRSELDITSGEAVDRVVRRLRPDFIVNCAAYTQVDRSEEEPGRAFAVNRDGVGNLAAAASEVAAKLVHISTDFVFDGRSSRPYRPDCETNPIGVYGQSKLAGESEALNRAADTLVIRTAWLYDREGRNFLTTMLRLMAERDEVRVVADQIGTPTSCRSLAKSIWKLAARNAAGIFHVTDSGAASWYDFAVAIRDEARTAGSLSREPEVVPIATSDFPTPARRPAYSVLDKSRTWHELGKPSRHWRVELAATLRGEHG